MFLSAAGEIQPALPPREIWRKPTPVTNRYSPSEQISQPSGDGESGGGTVEENTQEQETAACKGSDERAMTYQWCQNPVRTRE